MVMLDKNKEELEQIMGEYQRDIDALRLKRETESEAQQLFKDNFEELKHRVVWPTLVDIGNELTQYGHDFHVSEEEEYTDGAANYHPAGITFSIYPATLDAYFKRPESAPYIAFTADPYARKVKIMVSTMMPGEGGVIGQHGVFDLQEITTDLVERETIEVLKHIPIFHKS